MSADAQLAQLFNACDKKGKGYIVEEELKELCSGLGITAEDSNVIFTDLDQDKDGKICYQEFSKGFREFLNPETEVQNKRRFSIKSCESDEEGGHPLGDEELRRRESVYQAWNNLTNKLDEVTRTAIGKESGAQIRDLLQDLELTAAPPEVASRISGVLSTLLKELENLHQHHTSLEEMYKKERQHHATALKSLESELEDQVAKVERKAKQQARQESEEEKRILQDQMEEEVAKLNAHLMIFQKVDSWLKKDSGEGEMRKKLEDAYHANRNLNMSLNETATNLGLMRSEMAQLRLQYEEKCRELHSEREAVLEYMHQYDHMKRQLELLHQANMRLQDTNDSMRGAMEYEWRRSPAGSRCSSTRSSHRAKERRRSQRSLSQDSGRSRSPHPPILPSTENEGNIKFGIRRLMDDLDSGLSTLPDTAEEGCTTQDELKYETDGPMSLEDELNELETNSMAPSDVKKETSEEDSPFHERGPSTMNSNTPPPKPQRVTRLVNEAEKCRSPPPVPSHLQKASAYEIMGPPERTYKVVFAGDAAVGKSTFIVRLCKGCFVTNTASTLGVDYKMKTLNVDEKNIAIQLWDTAGQERFRSITKTYFRRADGVLLLYDVTSERSFLNVRQWIQSIDEACETRVPLVLCGNKTDLRDAASAEGRTTVSSAEGERLARDCGANFVETSCKSGSGVLESLVQLSRVMVTTEDVEIQTSALKVTAADQKRFCCGSRKER
ncbi:ras and EF-hand domain-containing protein homolog isoform X1 [Macrobrachium nipponense]|uniref:ras and EF-hand domain-containing protein homolog isoform X1 n=1 Tax=Macrobrachium nipponense TaxID=159736 RepID=UPI0030C7DB28